MAEQVKIKRAMIEADIRLFESKAELQRRLIDAYRERAEAERALTKRVLTFLGFLSSNMAIPEFDDWFRKHKAETEAQCDIYRVQLEEFRSQVQIRKAMLAEGDRLVKPA